MGSIQYNSLSQRDTANSQETLVRTAARIVAGYRGTGPPAARHTSSGLSDDGHRHAVRSGAARIHEIPGGRRNRQETDSSAAASGDGCHGCHGDPGNYVVRAHTTGFEGRPAPDCGTSTQGAETRGSPSRGI